MPRRMSRRSSRGTRPKFTWDNVIANQSLTAAAGSAITDVSLPQIAANDRQTGTIVRSIGQCKVTASDTPGDVSQLAVAMGLVGLDQFSGAGLPDPIGDVQVDWYYWHSVALLELLAQAPEDGLWSWDIRTSRKLRGGFRLALISENAVATQPMEVSVSMRNLWQVS